MASDAAVISFVLGGARFNGGSLLDIARWVENGLPLDSLDRVMRLVAPDDAKFVAAIIPKAALTRCRDLRNGSLSVEEGDKVYRLAKVWAMAVRVWGDEADGLEFLRRPHPMLNSRPPRRVAVGSAAGADAVINVIGRGAYGGTA